MIHQVGIAVVLVVGRCPSVVARRLVVRACPVHAHIVVGAVPATDIDTELHRAIHAANSLLGLLHQVVDRLGAELQPLLQVLVLVGHIRTDRTRMAGGQYILVQIDRLTHILLKLGFGQLREVAEHRVETTAVENDTVQILIGSQILQQRADVILHLGVEGVEEIGRRGEAPT